MRSALLLLPLALLLSVAACDDDNSGGGENDDSDARTEGDAGVDGADTSTGSLPLTDDLCDDPSNLALLDLAGDTGEPSFGEVNPELIRELLEDPTAGPFYMVNLIRFREQAVYPDGRETDLTGEEANELYSPVEFLTAIGARPVFVGDVGTVLIGDEGEWDQVAIVEYPCPLAFFAMTTNPEFQARSIHKDAGVEESIVMVTDLMSSGLPDGFEPPDSPFPATDEDPAFEMIHVLRYNETAQYEPGSDEPERTGQEAMDLYSSGAVEAANRVGVYPTAWFQVRGVFIGDGREWDEVRLNHMPSLAGFESLVMDPTRVDGQYHREAALASTYSLITYPTLSAIPGAPQSGAAPPPIASDGTGTVCSTDADCPGDGVDRCINPEGTGGFCTREGCGAGECADLYVCCHDCSDAVASFLPFTGSACFAEGSTEQLTSAPVSCTCD